MKRLLLGLTLLVTISCSHKTPVVIVQPPVTKLASVRISVVGEKGGPLSGALVTLDGEKVSLTTGDTGIALFTQVNPGPRHMWVKVDMYEPADAHLDVPFDGSTLELLAKMNLIPPPIVETPDPPQPPPPPVPPEPTYPTLAGRVRLDNRVFVDDNGPRPSLGATFFWLAWGYKNDRERTEANVKWLAHRGVDFVRALGEVGGNNLWSDRTVDPIGWSDYESVIRGATELVNRYGMRVEWTVFGAGVANTEAQQRLTIQRIVSALKPVVNGVQYIEIQNEQLGPPAALAREFAAYVRKELSVEVAISSAAETADGLPVLYGGSAATLATVHFDRSNGDFGWRPARQSWGYWEVRDVPRAFSSNEPIGIASSVRPENDPVKMATDAMVTWISGGAAYVLHTGAGIYGKPNFNAGGGQRVGNFWEQPTMEPTLTLLAQLRHVLPKDVANWTRANNQWTPPNPVPPFRFPDAAMGNSATSTNGVIRSYSATRGGEAWTALVGVMAPIQATPVYPTTGTVWNLSQWSINPWVGLADGRNTAFLVHTTRVP